MHQHVRSIGRLVLLGLLTGLVVIGVAVWQARPEGFVYPPITDRDITDEMLCLVGDTGKGGPRVERLSVRLLRIGCTQVRILGDLIYPDGLTGPDDPQLEEKFSYPFRKLLDADVPFYLLQGNHDFNSGAPDAWLTIAARDERLHYPALYYAERWGGLCIVSLETTLYEKLYWFHRRLAQTRWLADARAQLQPGCEFSLLLAHHPYQSPGRHDGALPQLGVFYEREVLGQFDLVVGGHEHILADVGPVAGTHQLVSGAGSKLGDVNNARPDTPFAVAEFGFVTLRFGRNDDKLSALAQFYTFKPGGLDLRWERRIDGQGWR